MYALHSDRHEITRLLEDIITVSTELRPVSIEGLVRLRKRRVFAFKITKTQTSMREKIHSRLHAGSYEGSPKVMVYHMYMVKGAKVPGHGIYHVRLELYACTD